VPERPRIEIRSYRAVFDLERRLYGVDGLRLNPSGVPVRGLVALAGLLVAVLAAQRLPLLGPGVAWLPWQLRYVALPCGAAALLTVLRIDGRPAHVALASVARFAVAPRHVVGFTRCPRPGSCWTPAAVALVDAGSAGLARAVRYRGPGAVLVRAPHELATRRGRAVLAVDGPAEAGSGRVVVVRAGTVLTVESDA
jgi:hypothetical protein